jgi:hypothetical protein
MASEPVYEGMPAVEREFKVGDWPGRIICGGKCKDDYKRIITRAYGANNHLHVTLQKAAMYSFLDASKAVGPIVLTGSIRSCAQQTELYRSDSSRYANPNTTAHTRGLAIDVSTAITKKRDDEIRKALFRRGWHQVRPDDEPWHYSFGIKV